MPFKGVRDAPVHRTILVFVFILNRPLYRIFSINQFFCICCVLWLVIMGPHEDKKESGVLFNVKQSYS